MIVNEFIVRMRDVVFMKFLFLRCGKDNDDDGGSSGGVGGSKKTTKIYAKHQVVYSNENIKEYLHSLAIQADTRVIIKLVGVTVLACVLYFVLCKRQSVQHVTF